MLDSINIAVTHNQVSPGRRYSYARCHPDLDSPLAYFYAPVLPYVRKLRITRSGPRGYNPRDVLYPAGFEIELVTSGFNGTVHCCFDDQGFCCVSEAGHNIDSKPRILNVDTGTGGYSTVLDLPEERWTKTGALTGSCWLNETLYFTNHPDGRLFATEHGIDERAARYIVGDLEHFYEIREGAWYGWQDFASGIRLDDPAWGDGGQ